MEGGGNLQTQYYQTMANYMSMFISSYNQSGIPIWYVASFSLKVVLTTRNRGVTPQNEPE